MALTLDSPPTARRGDALLPAAAKDFLKRRADEIAGGLMVAAALWLAVALYGYVPGDPSFNAASPLSPRNLLGAAGAATADLALQGIGLAVALPIVTLFMWGFHRFRHQRLGRPMYRIGLLVLATVFASMALSVLPVVETWPLMTGMGGFTGVLLVDPATALTAALYPAVKSVHVAAVAAVFALVTGIVALGYSWRQWIATAMAVRGGVSALGRGVRRSRQVIGVLPAWGTLRGKGAPADDDSDDELDPDEADADMEISVAVGGSKPKAAGRVAVAPKKSRPKVGKKAKAARQRSLDLEPGEVYEKPPLDLLENPPAGAARETLNKDALQQNARFLASVLEDFGVKGEIVKVRPGPVVTLYELEPAPGTKTSRVIGLSDDIARSMSAISVRVAVVPGRNVIGIELPNVDREMVYLRELLASEAFEKTSAKLPLALGKDIGGAPVTVDLARMPHLLIAGTTGSGKSVAMNTMILSLLYQCTPDECKFIMIDPKMLELSVYEGIPHLMTPVVTEPSKAVVALKWTVREMEDRYRAMSQLGVRNIAGYNQRLETARKKGEELTRRVQTGFDDDGQPIMEELPLSMDPLPFIVVVVDEMADLMLVAGKDVEATIQRLAQMARAAGIHLIMATQRPSVDVITGTIKANFPTRVSFQVTSKIDSRTILGEQGAEQLLGQGDMLYMAGGGRITRTHGPFVADEEVEEVVGHLKAQAMPQYIEEITREDDTQLTGPVGAAGGGSKADALYDEAVAVVAREGKASTSFIQRHLQIGYNRAARIIEQMEKEGVVSAANRVGRREVLVGDHSA